MSFRFPLGAVKNAFVVFPSTKLSLADDVAGFWLIRILSCLKRILFSILEWNYLLGIEQENFVIMILIRKFYESFIMYVVEIRGHTSATYPCVLM